MWTIACFVDITLLRVSMLGILFLFDAAFDPPTHQKTHSYVHIFFIMYIFVLFFIFLRSPKKCFACSETQIRFRIYWEKCVYFFTLNQLKDILICRIRIIQAYIWWKWKYDNFIYRRRPVSTSREPPCSELEWICERSDQISLRYQQGVNLVERRQVDFYICNV